jgi:subtilisin-like proprotein convertase family protein
MHTSFPFRRTAVTLSRLLLAGLLLTAWAGLPRTGYSAPEATVWYVAPGGLDTNPCTTAAKPCELIQTAINRANSGDTISIAPGIYIEELAITNKSLTLNGRDAAQTILDGNNAFQILSVRRESVPSMTVNISGVTLRNGKSSDQPGGAIANDRSNLTVSNSVIINNTSPNGGGIFNNYTLKLVNVTIRNNSAAGSATGSEGGGIYNSGSLELSSVLLANNQAPSGGAISNRFTVTVTTSSIVSNISTSGNGGGIYNVANSSKLNLVNSTLSGNESFTGFGGAIFNKGTLISNNTVIVGNKTTDKGGGIYNDPTGKATLTSNSIQKNTSVFEGGGLFNGGTAQIAVSQIRDNKADTTGGGIHNAAGGILTVTQSALIYNLSSTSGGLHNAGTAQLTNVTVSDNIATTFSGSGMQNSGGTLSLQFSTISNTLNNAGGSVTVGNSILAQSTGNACGGTITSAGYNLDMGTSCGFSAANHDLSNTNPQLGPLQNNGGGTLTRVIAFSSPAVDSAGACPPPTTDQRGIIRPQSLQQQPKCDRGAYEVVGYANFNQLDIGPGLYVTRTMTINDKFAIGRMLAGVNLTHPNRHDLTIRLLSPGTPKVTLLGPVANSGQNLNTMFDDSRSQFVPTGDQVTSLSFSNYVYKPATPLSQVRGMSIRGTWKLEICNAGTATGTLNYWVLVVPETTDFKVYLPIIKRN